MAATICPAVLASTTEDFHAQMVCASGFAVRVHIDLSDGIFTPVKTVPIDDIWWPGGVRADLHVMFKRPFEHLQAMIALKPQMIIVHAEADGDFEAFAEQAHNEGVETGVALLPNTQPELLKQALPYIDHVLIFSGDLGKFGGRADVRLLEKVAHLKQMKPQLEIGWDGGVNLENAGALAAGGIEVLNSGGFIQHARNPEEAYQALRRAANERPPTQSMPPRPSTPRSTSVMLPRTRFS
ncbi:MAG TPA: hypothetical protein VHT70_01150 [Candidatus Saccharimonadales bacterium]|nr:hypothetical protein [Candidatus Saccharimonadales bacterium]